MFQSRHTSDSKYSSEAFRHRSKLFRPKTRSIVRKNEAACAVAYFANPDVVSVEAQHGKDERQAASADIMKALLNYRLQKTVPWFEFLMCSIQDAQVMGAVCAYVYWKYRSKNTTQRMVDEFGLPFNQKVRKVLEDAPCIELWALENIRFDPAADWMDPIKSSPYVQRIVPMYVADIEQMMKEQNGAGQPKWKGLTRDEIRLSRRDLDSTRSTRDNQRQDAHTETSQVQDFEVVWALENFVRHAGEDFVYYTMGTQHMLSSPVPIDEVYFTGDRPFVFGKCVLEAHRALPDSLVHMGSDLQREANDVVNQRLDNVKLVLNKRWFVKQGLQGDFSSLNRNVAGGITIAENITEEAIREINWPDVTSSAYMEQDRVNVDYDELVGNFSGSSVMTNRKLNETVGGMAMLGQGASQLTEYLLRCFNETFVEKILRMLMKLEAKYETDTVVLGIAAEKAQLFQKYGIDQVTDEMLNHELTLKANVGMNATDPLMRLNRVMTGVKAFTEIAVNPPSGLNIQEFGKEVFSILGYPDGGRFLTEDPQMLQAKQVIQELQQVMGQMQQKIGQQEQMLEDKRVETGAKVIEMNLKADKTGAEIDKLEAETVKTLQEAMVVPDMALKKAASAKGANGR